MKFLGFLKAIFDDLILTGFILITTWNFRALLAIFAVPFEKGH